VTLHQQIHAQLLRMLSHAEPSENTLNNALRLLAKYRSILIQNTLVQRHGTRVMAGPFATMEFIERSAEGCHVPKLPGFYEEELHDFILALPGAGYTRVLNIGCAEGYYAVGIKRLLPEVRVLAYDINPAAQEACRALADKNAIEIEVGAEFKSEDFAQFASEKVLVWCDIEGAEIDLLDPTKPPALAGMDLLVELHPTLKGHTAGIVPQRFDTTHHIEIREARGHNPILPPFLKQLGHLDQLLTQWEWRSAPTPWAIMRTRSGI